MIGMVLGNRYRLDELIGEGGMALVYKAECSLLQRAVAIKILRPQFASDAEFVERFRREAQAAARLSHPNVVNVYDVGEDQGYNYIVMEYVRGENLKDLIRKEAPFTVARSLDITRQICEALHHAHQNNIIHRDIKPHNILITPEGRVKVTDFGIARAISASTLTQSGSVMGSVQYFSPEQAKGATAGVASDLYSLGCVLYEMLTATVPFKGESPISIALKHLQEQPPPLREHRPGIPFAVEALVARCLAKDPSLRFPSALAMLREIQAAQGRSAVSEKERRIDDLPTQLMPAVEPPRPGRRLRSFWLVLSLYGLGFVAILAFFYWWLVLSPKEPIVVPDLVGLKIEEAYMRVRASEFELEEIAQSSAEPRGTITRQYPEGGIRTKSRSIKVWVSSGPQEISLPDLTGMTPEQARTALEDKGLMMTVAPIPVRSETVGEGLVAEQNPKPGTTISIGATVEITLSQGNKFMVEDYRGLSWQEAVDRLRAQGVFFSVSWDSSDQPEGIVFDQVPAPNQLKPIGTVVYLKVSNGQQPTINQP